MRILVVEDNFELSHSIKADLEFNGYVVDIAMNGETGEFLGMTESYDVVVLDLGLPKMSGLDVLRSWRAAENHVPVIILTARDQWYEKVDGFKAGADDYLGKPFHIQELIARIQALLKRLTGTKLANLSQNGIALDQDLQSVTLSDGTVFELTAIEFRLLRYFMLYPGKVLSKTVLSEHIYEYEGDPDSNVIEVYVNRLRSKLGKDCISTRRGQGYVFGKSV